METLGDSWRLLETLGDSWRLLETLGNFWKQSLRLKSNNDFNCEICDYTAE